MVNISRDKHEIQHSHCLADWTGCLTVGHANGSITWVITLWVIRPTMGVDPGGMGDASPLTENVCVGGGAYVIIPPRNQ